MMNSSLCSNARADSAGAKSAASACLALTKINALKAPSLALTLASASVYLKSVKLASTSAKTLANAYRKPKTVLASTQVNALWVHLSTNKPAIALVQRKNAEKRKSGITQNVNAC